MKIWVRSWQTPRRSVKASAAVVVETSRIGVEFNFAIERGHQSVQQRQRIVAGIGARAVGEFGDAVVGLRQRGLAQEQLRRKALDRAAHNAVGVVSVDFAFDRDR